MGSENFCFVGFLNTEKAKVCLQRYLIKKNLHIFSSDEENIWSSWELNHHLDKVFFLGK